ncbi:Chondroitin sulfate synthase 3 [Bagarius yarrelli]|uniref:N-acetylgalactosaminyl-proteoglycan 3-beta-glucuronosyltransferase n=1 Tax=Bagarius yarrelli TaxID=175774 RepID=A0A556TJU7_BAGYA|nr:Chondroitin sulfate synthase 3 [Bagarius yarrelli]
MISCVDFIMALRSRKAWTNVMVGVLLGFTTASWLLVPRVSELKKTSMCSPYSLGKVLEIIKPPVTNDAWPENQHQPFSSRERSYEEEDEEQSLDKPSHEGTIPYPKHLLYVGVMTAKKYLDNRAVAAYKTWTPRIPGMVEFFSSQGSDSVPLPFSLPVVSLPGVDDSYPPQKKSFMMLKYMHDHYLDKYEWFMRADDDVYIRGEKLELFLRSLNSSKPLYLGQTGLGTTEELGKLALEPGENFCMGGPGMIFSREVLRMMVPHISTCLREMYTTHEDVEVGRCVRRFGGTQCVWSYEVSHG